MRLLRYTGLLRRGLLLFFLLTAGWAVKEAQADCAPSFPLEPGVSDGWQGADAAYSIPLGSGRALWVFGDTLWGPERVLSRTGPEAELRIVHNSLALSRCVPGGFWHVRYLLKKDSYGKPRSFFSPSDPAHWYWAMDGVRWRGQLLVSLLCLRKPEQPQAAALNFEFCGVDLASLPAHGLSAASAPRVQPLAPAWTDVQPAAALVVMHGFLYLFGVRGGEGRALIVSRAALGSAHDVANRLQTLERDGHWHLGFHPDRARPVFAETASEMSIRYHAQWRRWIAVYKDPNLLSDNVFMRSARTLLGPWSSPKLLFHIRALDRAASLGGVFCYAGKEHPEFAQPSELLVTYVCNSADPALLLREQALYLPRAVRIKFDGSLHVLQVRSTATRLP